MKRGGGLQHPLLRTTGWILGFGVILLLAATWRPQPGSRESRESLLSDRDGALQELVVHWTPEAISVAVPAWRDLFRALPASVTVHVACPDVAAFDELRRHLGPVAPTLVAHPLGHPLTCWSRDRWLALSDPAGAVALVLPEQEDAAAAWPGRAGDGLAGIELARRIPGIAGGKRGWQFDGGDVVADERTAFVTERMLKRNLGKMGATPAEVGDRLGALLRRQVVWLTDGPDHHACMVMMVAGRGRVVVGDPSLAVKILGDRVHAPDLVPCGDDFTAATQARFDAVARACANAGYAVTRIPLVPGRDGRAFLAWVNGMIDVRDGTSTFFMPSFPHAPKDLEMAAMAVWEKLGFRVIKADCDGAFNHGGSLRCLVNVLRRA